MKLVFQSTHPCGVRPHNNRSSQCRTRVSIHAPLRGATHRLVNAGNILGMFQSTHPCGVRQKQGEQVHEATQVSIHAPLRGATWYSNRTLETNTCFNPRTPAGCDAKPVNAAFTR